MAKAIIKRRSAAPRTTKQKPARKSVSPMPRKAVNTELHIGLYRLFDVMNRSTTAVAVLKAYAEAKLPDELADEEAHDVVDMCAQTLSRELAKLWGIFDQIERASLAGGKPFSYWPAKEMADAQEQAERAQKAAAAKEVS